MVDIKRVDFSLFFVVRRVVFVVCYYVTIS
uniref:Uncharacterized protein n=1 Tax=Podoviridae sp. ctvVI24 TaxID=2825285 RepID=A0A8S5UYK6_9CAUD|nr:MAG TPA: hypothetical protein [Podoviridae sp. ctvVI24]